MDTWSIRKNEPKTNPNEPKTNPNKANSKKAKMNVTAALTKEYENKSNWAICENEPKTNPNKANFRGKKMLGICQLFVIESASHLDFGIVNEGERSHLKNRQCFCKMVADETASIIVGLCESKALFCFGVE